MITPAFDSRRIFANLIGCIYSVFYIFLFADAYKSVLKTKQQFRNKFEITVNPVVLRNKNIEDDGVEIAEVLS